METGNENESPEPTDSERIRGCGSAACCLPDGFIINMMGNEYTNKIHVVTFWGWEIGWFHYYAVTERAPADGWSHMGGSDGYFPTLAMAVSARLKNLAAEHLQKAAKMSEAARFLEDNDQEDRTRPTDDRP